MKTQLLQKHLRRYTDLPALIYLLTESKITLLDPQSWDDSNDSSFLRIYREKNRLASVLALCFTQATETYHHWRVFANGASGVCIGFDRAQLLDVVNKHPGVRARAVTYLKLDQIRDRIPSSAELPFLKRYPFQNEREFRIIYESETEKISKLDIAIPLSCVERVTLSPWLARDLSSDVKKMLWAIEGCSTLEIARSTLIGNEEWKSLGESALGCRAAAQARRRAAAQT